MGEATRSGEDLAAAVEVDSLVPRWAKLARRYATAERVAEDVRALGRGDDRPERFVHGYLIGCLLEIGEAHTDCEVQDCPTCRALTRAVSMVLAENEVRQGHTPGAAHQPARPGA